MLYHSVISEAAYLLEIILEKRENRSEYSETKFFQTHPQGFLNFARILCYNYVKITLFSLPSPKHLRGMLCVANVGRNDNRAGRLHVSSPEIINSKRGNYLVTQWTSTTGGFKTKQRPSAEDSSRALERCDSLQ